MENIKEKREKLDSLTERLANLHRLNTALTKFQQQFEKECEEQGICLKQK